MFISESTNPDRVINSSFYAQMKIIDVRTETTRHIQKLENRIKLKNNQAEILIKINQKLKLSKELQSKLSEEMTAQERNGIDPQRLTVIKSETHFLTNLVAELDVLYIQMEQIETEIKES